MSQWRGSRSVWPVLALAVMLAAIPLIPRIGFTVAREGLWTERAVAVTPASPAVANWVQLARELKPAVVNVSTRRVQDGLPARPGPFRDQDPAERFFGARPRREVRSLGSGFIINPDGYLVTNNHVVDGATDIRVKLADGRELGAKIVGRDSKTDLALLKIEATGLPVVPLGDSSALQVAEPVMAIGNPFGLAQTVTTGIVSATGRVIGEGPYDDFIQTDASINPGNSGGPLINARGQAVGINTAIFSQSGGSIGIGFAIPINLAKSVVAALAEHGHVVRGWLGVAVQPLTPELAKALDVVASQGALVSAVTPGSPAMQAGLRPGDVITAYDGRKVGRTEDLPRAVAETPVGREVPLTVLRDGKTVSLMARIARLEEPVERVAATGEMGSGLGVAVQPLTPALARELGLSEIQGLLVRAVEDGSPASTVGLAAGDVIVEVDRQPVQSAADLKQVVDKHRGGPPILLLVHRNGESVFVAVSV